jgi:spore coat protein U-like protein
MKAFNLKALVLAAAALGSASAMAGSGSATTSLTNSTTIPSVCLISSVGFTNTYDPIVANASTDLKDGTSSSVTYTCTNGGTGATISLDQGLNPTGGSSATVPARQLSGSSGAATGSFLAYNLYSDSGYSTPWGASTASVQAIQDGESHTATVYVDIPAGQDEPVGSYTDTVVATINY